MLVFIVYCSHAPSQQIQWWLCNSILQVVQHYCEAGAPLLTTLLWGWCSTTHNTTVALMYTTLHQSRVEVLAWLIKPQWHQGLDSIMEWTKTCKTLFWANWRIYRYLTASSKLKVTLKACCSPLFPWLVATWKYVCDKNGGGGIVLLNILQKKYWKFNNSFRGLLEQHILNFVFLGGPW